MRTETRYLLEIIGSIVFNKNNPKLPRELDWDYVYNAAKIHGLTNIVYYGMDLIGFIPPPDIRQKLIDANRVAVYVEAQQELETRLIESMLTENRIRSMLLKGPIIRRLYPRPDMRSMADVDILVDAANLEKIKEIMRDNGYSLFSEGDHHDIYVKKPFMTVEFHRYLIGEKLDERLYEYYKDPWELACVSQESEYLFGLSIEDYYIFLLAHGAKHFKNGGCGIRTLIDLRVYLNYYNDSLDWDYIYDELEKCGLLKFSEVLRKLTEIWFCGAPGSEFYDELSDFIVESGLYGTQKNNMTNKVRKAGGSVRGAKIKQAFGMMFPTIEHMTVLYPRLEGNLWLLPFAYLHRAVKGLIKKRKVLRTIKTTVSINRGNVRSMEELFLQMGL